MGFMVKKHEPVLLAYFRRILIASHLYAIVKLLFVKFK